MDNANQNMGKIYSERAISFSTFLGGPLAAGILMSNNYKVFNNPEAARKSIVLSVFSTLALIIFLAFTPEPILEKIPQQFIPLIYTGIVYLLLNKYQKDDIQNHIENGFEKASGWKSFGIGILSLIIFFASFLPFYFISQPNFDSDKYQGLISEFLDNESQFLEFGNNLQSLPSEQHISKTREAIKLWELNSSIVDSMDSMENLPVELKETHKMLVKYCALRIESLNLLQKKLLEKTDIYDTELTEVVAEINALIK